MATNGATKWDVIVVGGGPSGSTAAGRLAAAGVKTLVLEKATHPRYKACGGGVPARTVELLDMSIESVIESTVDTIEVSHLGRRSFSKRSKKPLAYMVMRDRFDELLLNHAQGRGATVHEGEAVESVEIVEGGARVASNKERYEATYVIGADGATGVVGRSLGLGTSMATSAAWEVEFEAPAWALERWRGRANVDVGYRPWGYGWVFPKDGRLSVGVVLSPGHGKQIRFWGEQYAKRLGLQGTTITQAKGHPIRYRRNKERIARGSVMLVGDAAGLADEFTAEGIAYGIESGGLAAEAAIIALSGGADPTDGWVASTYESAINTTIQLELDAARAISRMYYWCVSTWPWLALNASKRVDYFWRAFFRVMRGESSYDEEMGKIPGLSLTTKVL